jgi:hypothetical protein
MLHEFFHNLVTPTLIIVEDDSLVIIDGFEQFDDPIQFDKCFGLDFAFLDRDEKLLQIVQIQCLQIFDG